VNNIAQRQVNPSASVFLVKYHVISAAQAVQSHSSATAAVQYKYWQCSTSTDNVTERVTK